METWYSLWQTATYNDAPVGISPTIPKLMEMRMGGLELRMKQGL